MASMMAVAQTLATSLRYFSVTFATQPASMTKVSRLHGLTRRQRARIRPFGKLRAKVEHVFRVVKC